MGYSRFDNIMISTVCGVIVASLITLVIMMANDSAKLEHVVCYDNGVKILDVTTVAKTFSADGNYRIYSADGVIRINAACIVTELKEANE